MIKIRTFRDILVWQKSHLLVQEIYRITKLFPMEERYNLTSQMRRAAYSVPCNIVEGFRRNGKTEGLRFYNIAAASLEELKYQTLLSLDLGYFHREKYLQLERQEEELSKMLASWIKANKKIRDEMIS